MHVHLLESSWTAQLIYKHDLRAISRLSIVESKFVTQARMRWKITSCTCRIINDKLTVILISGRLSSEDRDEFILCYRAKVLCEPFESLILPDECALARVRTCAQHLSREPASVFRPCSECWKLTFHCERACEEMRFLPQSSVVFSPLTLSH